MKKLIVSVDDVLRYFKINIAARPHTTIVAFDFRVLR